MKKSIADATLAEIFRDVRMYDLEMPLALNFDRDTHVKVRFDPHPHFYSVCKGHTLRDALIDFHAKFLELMEWDEFVMDHMNLDWAELKGKREMYIGRLSIKDLLRDVGPCKIHVQGEKVQVENQKFSASARSLKRALIAFGVYWFDRNVWDPNTLDLLDLDWNTIKEEL